MSEKRSVPLPSPFRPRVTMRRWYVIASGLLLAAATVVPHPVRAATQRAVSCDAPGVTPAWPRIHAVATGARKVAGNVTFTVYGDDPTVFLKHAGSIGIVRVPLTASRAEACVAVNVPGGYAIAIYHDENDNHHFDRTLLGLPAEGYGFSNDAPTFLGPPAFAQARIAVPAGGMRVTIRLRY